MFEMLHSIPGPQFLLIFPLLVISGIVVGRSVTNRGRDLHRMPPPSAFPPATIARLRGGWELVLKTTIFGLWQRGGIQLTDDAGDNDKVLHLFGKEIVRVHGKKAGVYLFRRAEGAPAPTERVEMAIWSFLKTERKPDDFFKDPTLQSFVETHVRQTQGELERQGLIKSADQRRRGWATFLLIFAAVEGIGIAKAVMGIARHRPSAFLVIMLVVSLFAFLLSLRPYAKLTPLGTLFLKKAEEHFAWLKEAVKGDQKPGIDPAYAFALFGTVALAGTLLYAPFSEAFPGRTAGGCGGSSCGGSGCSGGGCSGGGCGGCGGGD